MDGWVGGWVGGWMDEWMDGRPVSQPDRNGQKDRQID